MLVVLKEIGHDSPEIPLGRPAYAQTSIVGGVSHCDRNLFNGDAAALYRFWSAVD
jgi:hypothetical protein